MANLANIKKRRGVACVSNTRLVNRVKELEGEEHNPRTSDIAERLSMKLTQLDSDFRTQHHALIDLNEDDDALQREQETLDVYDDLVTELSVQIKQIISSPCGSDSSRKILQRKQTHVQKCIDSITAFVRDDSVVDADACLLQQYEEKASDINHDLVKIRDNLHCLDIDDTDELLQHQERLESQVFDCSVRIKNLSPEERAVVKHFEETHRRTPDGRFIVSLHKKPSSPLLGESRSQAMRRFLALKRSLHSNGEFDALDRVIQAYFNLEHAELVLVSDLDKPVQEVFYLPIHTVKKESSTTIKIRVVFDASAKSVSNASLNDILQVDPTIHSPLINVLMRFRFHRIALIADVSKMYRAVELDGPDHDFHHFVWRSNPNDPLKDYRMTRVTFGVLASSFAATMSVRQNALDHQN